MGLSIAWAASVFCNQEAVDRLTSCGDCQEAICSYRIHRIVCTSYMIAVELKTVLYSSVRSVAARRKRLAYPPGTRVQICSMRRTLAHHFESHIVLHRLPSRLRRQLDSQCRKPPARRWSHRTVLVHRWLELGPRKMEWLRHVVRSGHQIPSTYSLASTRVDCRHAQGRSFPLAKYNHSQQPNLSPSPSAPQLQFPLTSPTPFTSPSNTAPSTTGGYANSCMSLVRCLMTRSLRLTSAFRAASFLLSDMLCLVSSC